MWGSTSAERSENFIKLNRDWFCCSIHKGTEKMQTVLEVPIKAVNAGGIEGTSLCDVADVLVAETSVM